MNHHPWLFIIIIMMMIKFSFHDTFKKLLFSQLQIFKFSFWWHWFYSNGIEMHRANQKKLDKTCVNQRNETRPVWNKTIRQGIMKRTFWWHWWIGEWNGMNGWVDIFTIDSMHCIINIHDNQRLYYVWSSPHIQPM